MQFLRPQMSCPTRSVSHLPSRSRSGLGAYGRLRLAVAAAVVLAGVVTSGTAMAADNVEPQADATGAVFVMTNRSDGNQVIAYERSADGQLRQAGIYDTGGKGTSQIRLSSQASVTLTPDGNWLLVVNVGSNEISVFAVDGPRLQLVDIVDSHGETPNSIAVHDRFVYVLNNGRTRMGNIAVFVMQDDGTLSFVPGSERTLSARGSDPAQVAVSPDGSALMVTEKVTNKIDTWPLVSGLPTVLTVHDSVGRTPFGIDVTDGGVFLVTNAAVGEVGKATTSAYVIDGQGSRTISGAVPDFRSEACWTIISKDQRLVYATNFADGTISTYDIATDGSITLRDSVAAITSFGELSIRDGDLTPDGRYLYAIDIFARKVFGWRVESDGSLVAIGAFPGVPHTVAGIAVR